MEKYFIEQIEFAHGRIEIRQQMTADNYDSAVAWFNIYMDFIRQQPVNGNGVRLLKGRDSQHARIVESFSIWGV